MRNAAMVAIAVALGFILLQVAGNPQESARARAELEELTSRHDSLTAQVLHRQERHAVLLRERDTVRLLADQLRDSVDVLEARRAAGQLTIRRIRTVGALQSRLRAAFPELGDSGWGVISIPLDQRDQIGIEYLTVPVWFAETFAIDHANAESWRAQKDQLLSVDSLRLTVAALQDSMAVLEAANSTAWRLGYDTALGSYQDLSKRYVGELRKPRLGIASRLGLLLAVGAGLVVGALSR